MSIKRISLQALIGICILGLAVFFTSCKSEEPDAEPKLKAFINTISPAGGIPGMRVTILGKGFNANPAGNIVKFNGVTAEVVLAEETRLIVEVPEGGSTGLITVNANDNELTGPSFRFYEIFLLTESGLWDIGGTHDLTVWKNGDSLSSVTGYFAGKALKVSGNDTYIAGETFADENFFIAHPAYWKNTTLVPLQVEKSGWTTDIHVQGEDVYVSGMTDDLVLPLQAVYWKNAQLVKLTNGNPAHTQARTIEVLGSDVYVGGNAEGSVQTDVVYWKNGEINFLPNADKNTSLNDLKITGDTLHIIGTQYEGGPPRVKYWKTGKEWKDLSSPLFSNWANAMFVGNGKVLVAGSEINGEGVNEGRLWINGTSSDITDEIDGIVLRVEKIGNDIITCGIQNMGSDFYIYFAINDLIFPIESGQKLNIVDLVVR